MPLSVVEVRQELERIEYAWQQLYRKTVRGNFLRQHQVKTTPHELW